MVISCSAFGCYEKFIKGGPYTFHTFPKDEARKKEWERNLRRENFTATASSRVCSKHFEDSCFDKTKFGGTWLKSDAVPTIFNFPPHLKSLPVVPPQIKERKERKIVEAPQKRLTYIGDFSEEDMSSPEKAKKYFNLAKEEIKKKRDKIEYLQKKINRLEKKVHSLRGMSKDFTEKFKSSELENEARKVDKDKKPRRKRFLATLPVPDPAIESSVSVLEDSDCSNDSASSSKSADEIPCRCKLKTMGIKQEKEDSAAEQPETKPAVSGKEKLESPMVTSDNGTPSETSKLGNETEQFEIGKRRIVNINYFFHKLMQLNRHGPTGCSLNTMAIVSECRRGLATRVKFKCFVCNFEKCVWTENISDQIPLDLTSVTVTGSVENKRGLLKTRKEAVDDFLDILNTPSVSINATCAEKNKKGPGLPKVEETGNRLVAKTEDSDEEGFAVVVKGIWARKAVKQPKPRSKTSRPKATLKKQPDVVPIPTPEFQLESNSITKPLSLSNMVVLEINPGPIALRTQKSPEKILPDLSEPGPSKRMKLGSSTMVQDVHMAMTCDSYPAHAPPPDLLPKVKEEPTDPDECKQDNLPTIRLKEMKLISDEPSLTINQNESLFHPPVMIKEEPIDFEEES